MFETEEEYRELIERGFIIKKIKGRITSTGSYGYINLSSKLIGKIVKIRLADNDDITFSKLRFTKHNSS